VITHRRTPRPEYRDSGSPAFGFRKEAKVRLRDEKQNMNATTCQTSGTKLLHPRYLHQRRKEVVLLALTTRLQIALLPRRLPASGTRERRRLAQALPSPWGRGAGWGTNWSLVFAGPRHSARPAYWRSAAVRLSNL